MVAPMLILSEMVASSESSRIPADSMGVSRLCVKGHLRPSESANESVRYKCLICDQQGLFYMLHCSLAHSSSSMKLSSELMFGLSIQSTTLSLPTWVSSQLVHLVRAWRFFPQRRCRRQALGLLVAQAAVHIPPGHREPTLNTGHQQ